MHESDSNRPDEIQDTINPHDGNNDSIAKSIGKEFVDWAVTLGVAVVLALLIRHFLFAIFIVDGESMYPTLKDSEWLIVNKAIYVVGEPRKNDIVVFHATATRDYIKRVIAVEGDELEMVNGEVYVNGNLLDEPYINEPMSYHNNYDKIVIPENKIFVMGDNRNKSADSRMHDIGFIDVDQVVGRAELAFWPINDIRRVK